MIRKILAGVFATAILALASSAYADAVKPIRVCTGSESGNYYKVGLQFASQMDANAIQVIPTRGSWENLDKLSDGSCDAAIVQADAPEVYKSQSSKLPVIQRMASLYPEYAHLVCNVNSGVNDVEDLNKDTPVIIGQDGSGTYVTWTNFTQENKKYADVPTIPGNGDDSDALTLQAGDDAKCMLFITGLKSPKIQSLAKDSNGTLRLVNVDDSDLNNKLGDDKKPIYTFEKIENYPGFESRWTDIKTTSSKAVLYVNKQWVAGNGELYGKFAKAVRLSMPAIKAQFDPQ